MPRNGSGTYNLPAGNPVVTGTVISSTWANSTLSDIASALTGSLAANGQTPVTGNLNMNGFKLTALAAAVAAGQAIEFGQLAATGGAALVGFDPSGTVQDAIDGATGDIATNTAAIATLNTTGLDFPRVDVASASSVDLTDTTLYPKLAYVNFTGTTTINTIILRTGQKVDGLFAGVLQITNGASLLCPGGANITTTAGATIILRGEASSVTRVFAYIPYNPAGVFPAGSVGAPGVAVGTSTNGLYAPATNAAALVTAGVERLRIDGSGNRTSFIPGNTGLYPEFVCRAWLSFSVSGSTATITGSGNISSMSRIGAGLFTCSFSTAMPDTFYAVSGCGTSSASLGVSTLGPSTRNTGFFSNFSTIGMGTGGNNLSDPGFFTLTIHR